MKIFVTGFQRSGTSLLRDLIEKHPDVKKMWHEIGLLKFGKKELLNSDYLPDVKFLKLKNNRGKGIRGQKYKVDFNLKTDNWGEKIPYYRVIIKKGFHKSIIEYCSLWNEYFGEEAKIIHIVRHPLDIAISTRERGFSKSIITPVNAYKISVPRVINDMKKFNNVLTIKYENLLLNQEKTLLRIFKFCELDHSDEVIKNVITSDIFRFGKIEKTRAFRYKERKFDLNKLQLFSIIEMINREVKGVKYSL